MVVNVGEDVMSCRMLEVIETLTRFMLHACQPGVVWCDLVSQGKLEKLTEEHEKLLTYVSGPAGT